jgi:hypothetical protein
LRARKVPSVLGRALAKNPTCQDYSTRVSRQPHTLIRSSIRLPQNTSSTCRHRPPNCAPTVDLFNIDAFQIPCQLMQTHVYHSSAPKLAILPVLSPGSGSGASPRALPRHVREGPHFLGRHVVSIPPSSSATADHRLLTMRILALNPPNNNKLFDLISSIRP